MNLPSREAVGNSTAHMVAVLCMQLVREDPELVKRLQALAREQKAPFKADKLNEFAIEMAETGMTLMGQRLLQGRAMTAFELPVPRIENGLERTAGALAVGSFTTEFVHSHPERLRLFDEWMQKEHPDATAGADITQGAIEDADHMLTLMAHVSNHLLDAEVGDDQPEDKQPEPQQVSDVRYV